MAKVTRIKAPAVDAPQNRDQVATMIRQIGDMQRNLARESAAMNDAIAEITQRHQPSLDDLKKRIEAHQAGVQTWCESHRADITSGNKVKTANLVTGEVQWRQRPPSVRITGADVVIDTLKRLGLGRFVRSKEEVNKEAILADTKAVQGVAGIAVQSGIEDFVITPFEQTSEAA